MDRHIYRALLARQHYKGFVYGTYAKQGGNFVIFDKDTFERHVIDPTTLGQSTGLKDTEQTLMFEDDITEKDGVVGIIIWNECSFKVATADGRVDLYDWWFTSCKVIGNKYENPELLEKNNG